MIARIAPPEWPSDGSLSRAELASAYGLTEQQLNSALLDFANCEGCTDDGHECADAHEWLTCNTPPPVRDLHDYEWAE